MNAVHVARIGEAVDEIADELERILDRIIDPTPRLNLHLESAKHWVVVDTARNELVMYRTPDRGAAVRFAVEFKDRYPAAVLDESFGLLSDVEPAARDEREAEPDLPLAEVIPIARGAA